MWGFSWYGLCARTHACRCCNAGRSSPAGVAITYINAGSMPHLQVPSISSVPIHALAPCQPEPHFLHYPTSQGIIRGKSVDARVVERAAVGILRLCQRLLPYKPDVAEPLLRGLQVGISGPACYPGLVLSNLLAPVEPMPACMPGGTPVRRAG
jgi:hypothetical protein